jgi:hypothetical protein
MRNVYLEDAYVRLQQLESNLINENVSRSSLENQLNGIYLLLTRSQEKRKQPTIATAMDFIVRATAMTRVLPDFQSLGMGPAPVNFPQPFSPVVAPTGPNFSYTPFVFQQTSQMFPQAFKPGKPRLYEILTLVRQAKTLVLQMIRYNPNP